MSSLPPSLPPSLPTYLPLLKGSLIFIFIFLTWSSGGINIFKLGKFWISVFTIGKKSDFVPKIGGFGGQKRFPDLAENWLIWGSDDIKLFEFGTFWIPFFPTGKKSDLLSNFEILSQIPYGEERFFSGLYKSCWNSTRASLARTVLKLCALNNKKCGSRVYLTTTPHTWPDQSEAW